VRRDTEHRAWIRRGIFGARMHSEVIIRADLLALIRQGMLVVVHDHAILVHDHAFVHMPGHAGHPTHLAVVHHLTMIHLTMIHLTMMSFIELARITLGLGGILSITELGRRHQREGDEPAAKH